MGSTTERGGKGRMNAPRNTDAAPMSYAEWAEHRKAHDPEWCDCWLCYGQYADRWVRGELRDDER